ncbi:MAG: hypothetical protein ACLRVN_00750 [Butyricicoccus sp.]
MRWARPATPRLSSLARTHPLTMALTGGAVLSVCGGCVGAYTGKPALPRLRRGMHHGGGICGRLHGQPAFGCACGLPHEFGNVQGQICPKYAVLWTLLAAPIMLPK